jgi:DNA mismatch repair protein MSH4
MGTNSFLEEYDIPLDLKYETARQFYFRIAIADLEGRPLPPVFTNVFRKKNMIECQTLELMKRNQKVWVTGGFEITI